jgi:hypothetical protein
MKRTIYMSEPLERLAEETRGDSRRTSGFSRRLGEIVERYQIMLDLDTATLPVLTNTETAIMGEVICGSVIDRRKIRGLHLDVLDAELGSPKEKQALSGKVAALTAGQRLTLVEKLGQ